MHIRTHTRTAVERIVGRTGEGGKQCSTKPGKELRCWGRGREMPWRVPGGYFCGKLKVRLDAPQKTAERLVVMGAVGSRGAKCNSPLFHSAFCPFITERRQLASVITRIILLAHTTCAFVCRGQSVKNKRPLTRR